MDTQDARPHDAHPPDAHPDDAHPRDADPHDAPARRSGPAQPVARPWADIPPAAGLRSGTSRRAIAGERLSVVRARIEAGTSFDGSLHAHDHEQVLLMVAGRVELQIEEERAWVGPGEFAFFPSGAFHGAVGVGEDGAEYFEVFAPARIDQLIGYVGPSPLTFRSAS